MNGVRLRAVSVVLFLALAVFAFGSAMPVPTGNVLGQLLPMLPLAAIGIACATLLALFAPLAVTLLAIPLASAAAWLIGGDPLASLWTAALFLPVLALRRMLTAGLAATPTILRLSAICGAVWLPELYLTLGRAWGIWHPGDLLDRAIADFTSALQAVEIPVGGETMGYTAAQAETIANLLVMLLPAIILMLSAAMGWLSWRLTRLLFHLHGLDRLLTPAMQQLTLSRLGAVVFLIAAVFSFFGGDNLELPEALALNLILILEPPLALIGLEGLIAAFRGRDHINGTTLVCLILMLLTCSVSILLLLLALLGVIRTFRRGHAAE